MKFFCPLRPKIRRDKDGNLKVAAGKIDFVSGSVTVSEIPTIPWSCAFFQCRAPGSFSELCSNMIHLHRMKTKL